MVWAGLLTEESRLSIGSRRKCFSDGSAWSGVRGQVQVAQFMDAAVREDFHLFIVVSCASGVFQGKS